MKNNKQQTAVEWLWEIAYNRELTVEDWKQAKEMYNDEMEAVRIEICAEKSTSEANKYAEGYKEGYKRACDYMTDTIKNKIEIKQNSSNTFSTSGTTTTTRLCPVFVPNEFVFKHRCKNCGNERHQHTTPTNTP